METAAKSKLKDSQLVRAQNKLKELEAQLEEAKKAGADVVGGPELIDPVSTTYADLTNSRTHCSWW